jgi:hypothetical protein
VKLGFILEPQAASSNYRVVLPMDALERRGHTVIWPASVDDDTPARALLSCDLVHCFRRLDRTRDLKQLASRGVAISFDNDDDLAATDISGDATGTIRGHRGRFANIKKFNDILKITRFADLATTPSAVIAAKYREAGAANVAVIENQLDSDQKRDFGRRVTHAGIVLGWIAGREHEADLPSLSITDAVSRLLDQHENLRLLTVGARLPLSSPRYEYIEAVPFKELLQLARRIDIGVAPLADTQFNNARSNVKLKEYAAGGAVWLASPVGAYRDMGRGKGGELVEDDDWFGALDRLIRSGFKRRRLSREAVKWARSQTILDHVSVWEEAFEGAIERAQARMAASQARTASPR